MDISAFLLFKPKKWLEGRLHHNHRASLHASEGNPSSRKKYQRLSLNFMGSPSREVRRHFALMDMAVHAGGATKPWGYCEIFSGITTHGSFDRTQMCRSMLNHVGSSNVPAAMVRMPGRISAVCEIVVPHFGQKIIRSQRLLSSERCSTSDSSP